MATVDIWADPQADDAPDDPPPAPAPPEPPPCLIPACPVCAEEARTLDAE